jgi:hypothetical protein
MHLVLGLGFYTCGWLVHVVNHCDELWDNNTMKKCFCVHMPSMPCGVLVVGGGSLWPT